MSVRKGRPRTVSRAEDPPANGQPQLRVRVSRESAAWVQSQGGSSFLRGIILGVMYQATCNPSGLPISNSPSIGQPFVAEVTLNSAASSAPSPPATELPAAPPESRFQQAQRRRRQPPVKPLPNKGESDD